MGLWYYRHCPSGISNSLDWHVIDDDDGSSFLGCATETEAAEYVQKNNTMVLARRGLVTVQADVLERLEAHAERLRQYADQYEASLPWGGPTIYPVNPVTPKFALEIVRDIENLKVK